MAALSNVALAAALLCFRDASPRPPVICLLVENTSRSHAVCGLWSIYSAPSMSMKKPTPPVGRRISFVDIPAEDACFVLRGLFLLLLYDVSARLYFFSVFVRVRVRVLVNPPWVVLAGFFLAPRPPPRPAAAVIYTNSNTFAVVTVVNAEVYRFVTKGLRKTGETVYDFGVAAQNMTAEATEVKGGGNGKGGHVP